MNVVLILDSLVFRLSLLFAKSASEASKNSFWLNTIFFFKKTVKKCVWRFFRVLNSDRNLAANSTAASLLIKKNKMFFFINTNFPLPQKLKTKPFFKIFF